MTADLRGALVVRAESLELLVRCHGLGSSKFKRQSDNCSPTKTPTVFVPMPRL